MTMQERIRTSLEEAMECWYLDVQNESYLHAVPRNSETHFRVILVSPAFEGKNRVARHRMINKTLAGPLAQGVHALAIEATTPDEWETNGGPKLSAPPCKGGSNNDPDLKAHRGS